MITSASTHLPASAPCELIQSFIDPSGRVLLSTGPGHRKLGLREDDVVGRTVWEIYAGGREIVELWNDLLRRREHDVCMLEVAGTVWRLEVHPVTNGGRFLGMQLFAYPVEAPEPRLVDVGAEEPVADEAWVCISPIRFHSLRLEAGDVLIRTSGTWSRTHDIDASDAEALTRLGDPRLRPGAEFEKAPIASGEAPAPDVPPRAAPARPPLTVL